ncbi:MAG: methyltransferase domain-containing protein [Geminicoccaceae bacterium]
MSTSEVYLLGQRAEEEARLRVQMADLAPHSAAMLDRVGIRHGERVVDIGCGPGGVLDLLAERVGPAGSVLGLERSPHYLDLARRYIAEKGLAQVELREGDAYATGLPRGSFDGAHMRLVLVNVPRPEEIVREMVALVRPGGWIASFEADYASHACDPPLPAWDRLLAAFAANARSQGIDLHIGRRTRRLFRDAGVVDLQVDPVVSARLPGHPARRVLHTFVGNVADQLVAGGHIDRATLDADLAALARHVDDPGTLVVAHTFFRVWGRVPG